MSDEQNARAELKKRYGDFVSVFDEQDVIVQLYQKNTMLVKFLAMQGNSEHFIVENLKTPTGVMDKAVLRSCDTMFITLPFAAESSDA
uniref:Uncharacterized protein n=1 Tax=Panagrolaimus superbus TaxID=310955 RepID=A0A914YNF1_9BILA